MKRRIGVHTSIAGGVHLSLGRAKELSCSTIQIFSHNPRQWQARDIPRTVSEEFMKFRQLMDIEPVFIHSSYLINLCSGNQDIFEKSVRMVIRELELAHSIGADYVVLHIGSSPVDAMEGRTKAIAALRFISDYESWSPGILVENTAGEKGDITSLITDIAEIMDGVAGKLITGICLDSCHVFQAGYDISKEEGVSALAVEITKYLGRDSVKLIHLNDSKRAFNSRVDRHEHIGEGHIGLEGLKFFVNFPEFEAVPLVLETPKKNEEDDERNLRTVRRYLVEE